MGTIHNLHRDPEWILLVGLVILVLTGGLADSAGEADWSSYVFFGRSQHQPAAMPNDGRIAAVFGRNGIDLRTATLDGERSVLHAHATFGAIDIRVPEEWVVELDGTPVLGATRAPSAPVPAEDRHTLIVKARAFLGTVNVHH